jgi:ABC-type sugar transport system permease subunit
MRGKVKPAGGTPMIEASRRLRIVFTAVPIGFMALILVLPALQGVVLAFDSHGPSLANFAIVMRDRLFWRAFANNLIVPAGSLAVEFALGLAIALVLGAGGRTAASIEVAAILPFAIPEIVLLAIARFILIPRGYLNGALAGIGANPPDWLAPQSALALTSVIVVDAWHVTPIVMLMLLTGLRSIPREVYEAAQLDGAGPFATFRFITLPLLFPAMLGALVLRGIDALRIFSTTLVLTGAEGVPVLSTYAYQLWSDAQEPRLAMATSVLLATMVTVVGLAASRLIRAAPRAEAAL